jgi:hypothetical protein
MRPVTGTTVIMSLRISRESPDEHAADAAAASCHNAGTARIHPRWPRSESRPPPDSPARDPSTCTHSSRPLVESGAGQPCRPRAWPHIDHLVWPAALDPSAALQCIQIRRFFVCAVTMDRPRSVTAGVFRSSPAASSSRVGGLVVASADSAEVSAASYRERRPSASGSVRRQFPVKTR